MVAKSEFGADEIAGLDYDVGDLVAVRPIAAGTVQTTLLVETVRGRYVLKVYENRSRESVRFEANLIHYIRQHDFPTAGCVRNRQGLWVGTIRDKPCILFEFVDGVPLDALSAEQQRQVIHTAARLQVLTRRYRPRLRDFRWNYDPALGLELAREQTDKLGMAAAKLRWYEAQVAGLHLPVTLPKGICHADYDLSNLLFVDGDLNALIDFDDANYTYLSFDLIHLIDLVAWPFDGDFDLSAARQVVQTYMDVRPLSGLERRHLFDVHKLQILIDCIWFYGRGEVDDFYERQKIEHLDAIGRVGYGAALFG